jgi:hypothetical protein
MQDRCTVCAECTICFEIALGTPDGNPGWLDQAKDHISFFGDSVNLDARYVHGLRRAYHRFRNHFGVQPMVLLCGVGQVETHFATFGDRISMQDKCMICAECSIGSEIILAQPMVFLCEVERVATRFGTFGDSVNVDTR